MSDNQEDGFAEELVSPDNEGRGVTIDDFVAFMPTHTYIFTPCREFWAGTSVNSRLPRMPILNKKGRQKRGATGKPMTMAATQWLDRNRPVEQMSWCPGLPMLIPNRLVVVGGWIKRADVTTFNLYRPPRIELGDATKAGPWLDHLHTIYPDDATHIKYWLAQRVQMPAIKINHALFMGGPQGIGKDTLLEPVKYRVGPWNFQEVSPTHLLGTFNSFARSVILRVNEARDLGDVNRFSFYDHTKIYTAAPPDVLRVNEKNLREYYVFNVLGFLITTNHRSDGIYLPEDDRRHYVAWSKKMKDDFTAKYWNKLWAWYRHGGFGHVVAYLSELDLSKFDPKAPPPKTAAFWDIVSSNSAPEDSELTDVIEALDNPDAVTLAVLIDQATTKGNEAADWLMDRRHRRSIPYRMERCGFWRWTLQGEGQEPSRLRQSEPEPAGADSSGKEVGLKCSGDRPSAALSPATMKTGAELVVARRDANKPGAVLYASNTGRPCKKSAHQSENSSPKVRR